MYTYVCHLSYRTWYYIDGKTKYIRNNHGHIQNILKHVGDILSKEPYIVEKVFYIVAKESFVSTRGLCISYLYAGPKIFFVSQRGKNLL